MLLAMLLTLCTGARLGVASPDFNLAKLPASPHVQTGVYAARDRSPALTARCRGGCSLHAWGGPASNLEDPGYPATLLGPLRTRRPGLFLARTAFRGVRGLLSLVVSCATCLPLCRRARKRGQAGTWHNGGPVPHRYRPLLHELQKQVAAVPGLESRARKVGHELDAITLTRFLEAAYWKLEFEGKPVSKILQDTVTWRERVGAHRVRSEQVKGPGSTGLLFVKGHDLHMRPVVYFTPALQDSYDKEDSVRVMVYTLERAIRLMPRGTWQYTIVVDCAGMRVNNMPPLSYLKMLFKLLMRHYPMRLGVVIFANTSSVMMLAWKLVSPLLNDRTKAKMRFISSKNTQEINKYIHTSQLLDQLGGTSPWHFDPDQYFGPRGDHFSR